MKFLLSKYWKSVVTILIISYLSFTPGSELPDLHPFSNFDKFVHIIMYLFLTGVVVFDNRKEIIYSESRRRNLILSLVFPVVFGGLVEIMQGAFFKPRTADWFDWLADIVGVLIGLMVFELLLKFINRKR